MSSATEWSPPPLDTEWQPPVPEVVEAAPTQQSLVDIGIEGEFLQRNPKYEVLLQEMYEYANISHACRVAGVNRRTLHNWRVKDPEFDAACIIAYQAGMSALEDEAVRRAQKGVVEDVFYNGVVCGQKRKFSDGLTQFLLEGNMPDKYRKRIDAKVEHSGPLNTLVVPATMDMQEWLNKHGG